MPCREVGNYSAPRIGADADMLGMGCEWKDADKDIRYYDDPIDGKVEIPADAPPRPSDEAIWNVLSQKWVDTDGQHSGS